jgi:hypothetical protein
MAKSERPLALPDILKTLNMAVKHLANAKSLKDGNIIFRLKGEGGGDFCIRCLEKSTRLLRSVPKTAEPPLIELIGSKDAIQKILEKKSDPLVQFMRGNFLIRGDIRYISDLALEFKLIKQPL